MADAGALGTLKKAGMPSCSTCACILCLTWIRAGTLITGTLRGLGQRTLQKLKGGSSGTTIKKGPTYNDAEVAKIKDKITADWKRLKVVCL